MSDKKALFFTIGIGLFIIGVSIIFNIYSAKKEADIFNRFSETKITWWDAMWGDFRILPK